MAEAKLSLFTQKVIALIQAIPAGRVSSYGDIAAAAENPQAARQVVRILHSLTKKYDLPWHRVVNKEGRLSTQNELMLEQGQRLMAEGVQVEHGVICEFTTCRWRPLP
jgi:methylated-DNA-protein-cysteine methyltransferase-like protein